MADFKTAIPYIRKAEGGLSRATTDTASENPAPFTYQGKIGWHTNKGITWTTFSGLASKLGYEPTAANFFSMPDSIWEKIYKDGYWNPMMAGSFKSDAIAVAIVDYAWAFGVGGATTRLKKWVKSTFGIDAKTMTDVVNTVNKQPDEAETFNKLILHRKAAFSALKQPANEKGWLTRMDVLKDFGSSLLKTISQNTGTIGISIFFLVWQYLAM
jgi:lysozyme family protein